MKSSASPRRPVRKVRLDLRRAAPPPPPEDDVQARRNRAFWRWFGVVALFHVLLFIVVAFFLHEKPAPPPDQFMSLEPLGDVVKGTPGEQSAPKVGTSTPAPAHHRHHLHPVTPTPQPQPTPPPPVAPPPQPVTPPTVVQPPPPPAPTPVPNLTPVVKQTAPPIPPKKKVKPKPVKPKLKVNLTLQEGPPVDVPPKPVHKHIKKIVPKETDDQTNDNDDSADSNNSGLSKEQIARKLGEKLDDSGVKNSTLIGKSGAANGQDNPLGDFYNSIAQQIENKYQVPNQDDLQAVNPLIHIHVEPDGLVPADQVTIVRSSGNQAIDDAVLSAAKSIGHTLEPLPHGCNPDISINFQLSH